MDIKVKIVDEKGSLPIENVEKQLYHKIRKIVSGKRYQDKIARVVATVTNNSENPPFLTKIVVVLADNSVVIGSCRHENPYSSVHIAANRRIWALDKKIAAKKDDKTDYDYKEKIKDASIPEDEPEDEEE